jgi:hypothetical protein
MNREYLNVKDCDGLKLYAGDRIEDRGEMGTVGKYKDNSENSPWKILAKAEMDNNPGVYKVFMSKDSEHTYLGIRKIK